MALSAVGVAAQYSLVHGSASVRRSSACFSAVLGAGSIVAALSGGRVIDRIGERGWRSPVWRTLRRATCCVRRDGCRLALRLVRARLRVAVCVPGDAQHRAALRPRTLQGRVSAAVTLALFGPQAPMQALGSLLISDVGYATLFVASAVVSLAIGGWLAVSR